MSRVQVTSLFVRYDICKAEHEDYTSYAASPLCGESLLNPNPILCIFCGAYPTTSCSASSCACHIHHIRCLRPLLPTPRRTVRWPQPSAQVLTPHFRVRNRVSFVTPFLCLYKTIEKSMATACTASGIPSWLVRVSYRHMEPICVGLPTSHSIMRKALVCKPECPPDHIPAR